jgi:hypothetical protein
VSQQEKIKHGGSQRDFVSSVKYPGSDPGWKGGSERDPKGNPVGHGSFHGCGPSNSHNGEKKVAGVEQEQS